MTSTVTIGYTLNQGSRTESEQGTIDLGSLISIEAGQEALAELLGHFREVVEGYYNLLIEEL